MAGCISCCEVAQKVYRDKFPVCYDCSELFESYLDKMILKLLYTLKERSKMLAKDVEALEKICKSLFPDSQKLPNQEFFSWAPTSERVPILSNIPAEAIDYAHKDWSPPLGKLDAWAQMKGVDTTNWYETKPGKPRLVMKEKESGT